MPAVQLQTQAGQTAWFFFEEGDGTTAATAYKQAGTSAIANLLNATTQAVPTAGVLTDFIIGSGSAVSNYVLLTGRAFLLRIPAGMQGDRLYIRVRFASGVEERLSDTDGLPIFVSYTSAQSVVAFPALVDAIGSEIALEAATGEIAANQSANRTLQIKSLR